MKCYMCFVLLAWMLILLCEFNNGQKTIQRSPRRVRVRYVPVSTSKALGRLRLYRLPSGQIVRYRTRGRSPNVNVIRANSSPRRQIAKSTKVNNRKKVTTNNIKQTIILAKTANIMSPVGGNQNNGPSAVVSKGVRARPRQQKPRSSPASAAVPPPPPPAGQKHMQRRQNQPQVIQHTINIHHHGAPGHAGRGNGHMAGSPGNFGGQVASVGIPVNIGNGQGIGGLLGGHIGSAAAGHPGHSGHGNGHGGAHLNNNHFNNFGAGNQGNGGQGHGGQGSGGHGNGLGDLLLGGMGNANGNNLAKLNALLGGLTGFGSPNAGQNNGLSLDVHGQNAGHGQGNSLGHGQGHEQGHSQGHGNGNGNNQFSSMLANVNALNMLGGNGPEFSNPELMSQLLSANLLSGGGQQAANGNLLNSLPQSSGAGNPSDILLQSLLGGNANMINGLQNFNGMNNMNGVPNIPDLSSMAVASSGLHGSSAGAFDLKGMSSVFSGQFSSLPPSLGVTQQPVVIKSNGGQLNIGLKKDPNTGKSNIVIQTAAAAMAQEMMEAEPGEMR